MPVTDYGHDYAQWYGGCYVVHEDRPAVVSGVVHPDGTGHRDRRIVKEDRVRFLLDSGAVVAPADVVYTMPHTVGAVVVPDLDLIVNVCRVGARQWKRGVHPRTLRLATPAVLRRITGTGGMSTERLLRYCAKEVFLPTYEQWDVALEGERRAHVLSPHVWVYKMPKATLLGYRDHVVGTVDDGIVYLYGPAKHLRDIMEDVFTGAEVRVK